MLNTVHPTAFQEPQHGSSIRVLPPLPSIQMHQKSQRKKGQNLLGSNQVDYWLWSLTWFNNPLEENLSTQSNSKISVRYILHKGFIPLLPKFMHVCYFTDVLPKTFSDVQLIIYYCPFYFFFPLQVIAKSLLTFGLSVENKDSSLPFWTPSPSHPH